MESRGHPSTAEEPAVQFHVLCTLCQSLFENTLCVHPKEINCSGRHGQYHHHIKELRRSAADGCHLCNIFLYQIDNDESSFPDDFLKDDFTPWIMMDVHAEPEQLPTADFETADRTGLNGISSKIIYLLIHRERPREQIGSIGGVYLKYLSTAEHSLSANDGITSSKTNSEESFRLMQDWLADCLGNHRDCNSVMEEREDYTLPTRLLDLTDMNTRSIVRVIDTNKLATKPSYMTLSHCWGNMDCLMLTYDNYSELQAGFSVDQLPLTFREAAFVVTRLNCYYIWIDSLCIIQDSIEDWMMECATMTAVYSNAHLNIAAGAAHNSDEGLFRDRNVLPLASCHIKASCSCTAERWISCIGSNPGIISGPLHKRAWVTQELLLAPRVITFGHERLNWQCYEHFGTETDTENPVFNRPKRWLVGLEQSKPTAFSLKAPEIDIWQSDHLMDWKDSPLRAWRQIIRGYSDANLTFEKDKLVAIAGIAKKMHNCTQGKLGSYLAGLWEHELWRQITWRTTSEGCRRPITYRSPSWSWASVEGSVNLDSGCIQKVWRYVMNIIEAKTTPVLDPFGAVTAGYLRILARLCCISLREKDPKRSANLNQDSEDSSEQDSDEFDWCPWGQVEIEGALFDGPDLWLSADDRNDLLQLQKDRSTLYIMPVYEEQHWGFTALALRPTGQKHGQFHRVGLVDPYKDAIVTALNEAIATQDLSAQLHQERDESGRFILELV